MGGNQRELVARERWIIDGDFGLWRYVWQALRRDANQVLAQRLLCAIALRAALVLGVLLEDVAGRLAVVVDKAVVGGEATE